MLPERYPETARRFAPRRVKRASFTDQFLRGLKPATKLEERYEVFDEGTKRAKYPGLAIRVSHTGRKIFVVLYHRNGRLRRYTIGEFPIRTLRDAREKALEIVRDKDIDPAERNRQRRAAPRFSELAEAFRQRYIETDAIRPATAEDYVRRLRHLVSHFGDMKVTDIAIEDVEDFRDERAETPVGTNRTIEVLSRVFSWAREDRELRPFVPSNPCSGLKALRERPENRVLKSAELKAVLKAGSKLTERWRDALWWLALHGCRPGDIYTRTRIKRGIRWEHFDIEAKEWLLPETKSEPRVVPLTDAALRIIDRVRAYSSDEFVFRVRWDTLGAAVRRETGLEFSPKDLRTTCATEMQRLGVLPDIIDRVQGRRPWGPAVRARYQKYAYLEEQRHALELWRKKLLSIAPEPRG